jgi:hypothetical protein
VLESTTTDDVCGKRLVDPNQLDCRLDDLDWTHRAPHRETWWARATSARYGGAGQAVPTVSAAGGLELILYGA